MSGVAESLELLLRISFDLPPRVHVESVALLYPRRWQWNHEEVGGSGGKSWCRWGDAFLRSYWGTSHETLLYSPGRSFKEQDWPLPRLSGFLSHHEISPCDLSCLHTHLPWYYPPWNEAREAITRRELTLSHVPEAPKLWDKQTPFLPRLPSLKYLYYSNGKHINT